MTNFIGPSAIHVPIPIYGEPITDDDGIERRSVTEYAPGYHVNIARSDITDALGAFEVTPGPNTPANTWAGDEQGDDGCWLNTAFLAFADEAEAREALGGLLYPDDPE